VTLHTFCRVWLLSQRNGMFLGMRKGSAQQEGTYCATTREPGHSNLSIPPK
jgi:hypothetical protein